MKTKSQDTIVQEVQKVRSNIYGRVKNMTTSERTKYFNDRMAQYLATQSRVKTVDY